MAKSYLGTNTSTQTLLTEQEVGRSQVSLVVAAVMNVVTW